jgi:hypothetical protein
MTNINAAGESDRRDYNLSTPKAIQELLNFEGIQNNAANLL